MMIRTAKLLLLCGVALFYSLVVFNNLTDYNSNWQFVRHVLLMDTTMPGNNGMGRAISSPAIDRAFYVSIIAWEMATMILLWWGIARLSRALAAFFLMARVGTADVPPQATPAAASRHARCAAR